MSRHPAKSAEMAAEALRELLHAAGDLPADPAGLYGLLDPLRATAQRLADISDLLAHRCVRAAETGRHGATDDGSEAGVLLATARMKLWDAAQGARDAAAGLTDAHAILGHLRPGGQGATPVADDTIL